MNPGLGALPGFLLAALNPSALAESHGNPWWLWIIVFVVLAAFVGFMLWWWLHGSEEEEEPARHAETPPPIPAPPAAQVDDLKRIEGIGPRIAGLLQEAGITSFAQLANTSADRIREILEATNPNLLRLADPTTWPQQAALAAEGNWQAMEELQDELKGGRRV